MIIYQITNEKKQVVMPNWLEGFQQKLTDQPRAFICGEQICYNEWYYSELFVCGDKICERKFHTQKFMETSWFPTESGLYRITVFA